VAGLKTSTERWRRSTCRRCRDNLNRQNAWMGEPRSCGAPVIGLGRRESLQGNQPKIRRCDDAHSNAAHLIVPAASRSAQYHRSHRSTTNCLAIDFSASAPNFGADRSKTIGRAQVALIEELIRPPNLFADTSGVRFFDLVADAVRRAGAHKIIFGSDGPCTPE
jgi:hypothetical protein